MRDGMRGEAPLYDLGGRNGKWRWYLQAVGIKTLVEMNG